MLAAYYEVHPKIIRNLPGTGACDLESSLLRQVGQDVPYIGALPCGMTLQQALLPDKRLEFRLAKLKIGHFLPTTFNNSILQLPLQEKG